MTEFNVGDTVTWMIPPARKRSQGRIVELRDSGSAIVEYKEGDRYGRTRTRSKRIALSSYVEKVN